VNGLALASPAAHRSSRAVAPPAAHDAGRGLLSNLPASLAERRLALAVVLVSTAIFAGAAPFAKLQLAPMPAFLPAYQSALIINDLITAVLLLGQFSILRSRAMLFLAGAYLFSACMAVAHALSFPGLFLQSGLLGAGPQTTAWLYFMWHAGFPLLVIAYALAPNGERAARVAAAPRLALAGCVGAVLALACGLTLFATAGHDFLPTIMAGNRDAPAKVVVATATWGLCLAALPLLWRRRPHSVLDLWLMVVMCAWLFDTALASVLNAGRFDLGWYAGRIYGLLAASFVLIVLLLENGVLYARVTRAYAAEQRERAQAEQKSAELAAANKELDAFSYSVSHDLRAPLRAVDGYARMLEEDHGERLDDEGRRMLARVRSGSLQMNRLIEDLLEFSRVGRADLRRLEVDMAALAREAAALPPEAAHVRVEIGEVPAASGDRVLLGQVWTNLLSNALKYSGKRKDARVEVGARAEAAENVYWVRDNGVGFDPRYAARLFGVFQRLHRAEEFPGTGVGLAIVQRVVTRHGGRVWAESALGEGACFYFSLPREAA
jgi:signal transduction histidine kinase